MSRALFRLQLTRRFGTRLGSPELTGLSERLAGINMTPDRSYARSYGEVQMTLAPRPAEADADALQRRYDTLRLGMSRFCVDPAGRYHDEVMFILMVMVMMTAAGKSGGSCHTSFLFIRLRD